MHFYRGSGLGAAKYFDEGHQGAEAYYSENARVAVEIDTWNAGERVGRTTLPAEGDLVKWVEGIDPKSGEVKGLIRSGGADRPPLRFVEVVVNNPKSLSIVASQNSVVSAALDTVLDRQADEIARYLSAVAVTRTGPRGAQVEVGNLTVETARVRHLTSREGDPHRHVHLMMNTRVKAPDGSWRGLHSAGIRQQIRAVNERGTRVLMTDLGLRQALASQGYTLGADGEVDQARGAVTLMSKRTAQVGEDRERLEVAWRLAHPEREPSQRVKNGWDQGAWASSRRAKGKEREGPEELAARVRVELAEAGFDFTLDARQPVRTERVPVAEVDRDSVATEAVAMLSGQKSAWSRADLIAAVEVAVVRSGVVAESVPVAELVEDCEARALERCRSVLDAERHTPTVMARYLTSDAVIAADTALNLGLAGLAGESAGRDRVGGVLALVRGLGAGQIEAVEALAGARRLEVVIGPAGSGKTKMLAVARERVAAQGRDLVVVAPTRKGAMVAAAEVGAEGSSLSALLYRHGFRWDEAGRWSRVLAGGDETPATSRPRQGRREGPGSSIRPFSTPLSPDSVIVVDEAALMTVDQANALIDLTAESGAALRLVGDPRQLGAVGRGGVMETASRWAQSTVTLDEVHRFVRTRVDEAGMPVTETDRDYAALSLALREGTEPDAVVEQLFARDMVVLHASEGEAVAAIATDAAPDLERLGAVAVTVATNAEAELVNQAVRGLRVSAGTVNDTVVTLGMEGVRIGPGDHIVTRRNDAERNVSNRQSWVVKEVLSDGAVVAGDGAHRVYLDPSYVAEAVQLGYACTDYGNEGVTTARSVTSVGAATSAGGLYVGATRGRYDNTLHLVAQNREDARMQLVAALGRDRADRGLEVARARAEAEATRTERRAERTPDQVPVERVSDEHAMDEPQLEPSPLEPIRAEPPAIDPAQWRTEADFDRMERQIERRFTRDTETLHPVAVMPDDERQRANEVDQAAAAAARGEAATERAEADRIAATKDELVVRATADFEAAREDSRIIAAGTGRFGRKAAKVEEARAHWKEVYWRWHEGTPSADWSDEAVRSRAAGAAERIVNADVRAHRAQAAQADKRAAKHDNAVAERERSRERAISRNERNAQNREVLVAEVERDRATVAEGRALRAEIVADMSPEEINALDQAREAIVVARARQRLMEQQLEASKAHERHRGIDRGGPGFGL
jgi:exodeoxyribonuclease V alpha subunit